MCRLIHIKNSLLKASLFTGRKELLDIHNRSPFLANGSTDFTFFDLNDVILQQKFWGLKFKGPDGKVLNKVQINNNYFWYINLLQTLNVFDKSYHSHTYFLCWQERYAILRLGHIEHQVI